MTCLGASMGGAHFSAPTFDETVPELGPRLDKMRRMESFAPYLDVAIKAARAAGDLLRADFHRPVGPRGEKDKSPTDTEAEQIIRDMLLGVNGDWGFLGEETGAVPGAAGAPVWVVDPNDGTRDYIKGRRGSSVSIALVAGRRPVLGVVHPFGYPDDDGPMYSAAVGREGVWKNGAPAPFRMAERLSDLDVVLVSGGGDRAARSNLACTKPARVMSIPSIAHRMALVASGEAAATTSLYSPKTWDYAAGHCLVLAAGGAVVDQHGNEPVYDENGDGASERLFVGSPGVALELAKRNWDLAFKSERETAMPIARLRKGGGFADPVGLSRAQGAFLGFLAGSSMGALFPPSSSTGGERLRSASISAAAVARRMMAGQLGSAGEIAVATARSLADQASDPRSLQQTYVSWANSAPPEPDRAFTALAKGTAMSERPSAMALARVMPFTLWGHEADSVVLATTIRADTKLTHAPEVAGDAGAVLAIVLQALLHRQDALSAIDYAHSFARRSKLSREVIDAVAESAISPGLTGPSPDAPVVATALQFALHQLAHTRSFEEALEAALQNGSTSDVLPAVVGALMGARFGRDGVSWKLRRMVLSCRPLDGLVATPRPPVYWATDAMALSEALLRAR